MAMHFEQNDERAYTYFVKLPEIDHKFAIGCKNLSSASIADVIELGKIVYNIWFSALNNIFINTQQRMLENDPITITMQNLLYIVLKSIN